MLALTVPVFAQERPILPDEERFGRQTTISASASVLIRAIPAGNSTRPMGEAIADACCSSRKCMWSTTPMTRLEFDDIYRACWPIVRVYFGFKLIAGGYPEWVTVTRAYYETGYIFVAKPPAPARSPIFPARGAGRHLGSVADFRLVQYNNAACRAALAALSHEHGRTGARSRGQWRSGSIAWSGHRHFSSWARPSPNIAELDVVASPAPLTIPPMPVGAIMLSRDTFLRNNIDQAIGDSGRRWGDHRSAGGPAHARIGAA